MKPTPVETLFPVGFPLDLRRTLSPLGGRFLDDGWWRPARTPIGPATLHLRRGAEGIVASAWGDGASWLLDRVPCLIGSDDRPEDFVTSHPLVSGLARRHRGFRFGATGLVWEALVIAIVAQKVAGKEAGHSLKQLARRFSEPAPGPKNLRLPPDPEPMAASPYWEYHTLGIERRRADVLRRAAGEATRIQQLAEARSPVAASRLKRLRGVGEWTAAETVAISHGDPDAVSVGDYHLKNVVAWHLTGRPRGTDEEMLRLLEPFRPHRGRVIRLLETRGGAPAFGPRQPLRSFTDR